MATSLTKQACLSGIKAGRYAGQYLGRTCISEVVPEDVGYHCLQHDQLIPDIHTISMLFFVKPIFICVLEKFPNCEVKKIVTKFSAVFFY